jgi:DNA-3-methyladenine glycosylase
MPAVGRELGGINNDMISLPLPLQIPLFMLCSVFQYLYPWFLILDSWFLALDSIALLTQSNLFYHIMSFSSPRCHESFFSRDVLEVAPALLSSYLVKNEKGTKRRYRITEVEAYRGEEDLACHACRGKTRRTEVMYLGGGHLYIYLIYGMYWMLNIVTGKENQPQAALIRSIENISGPGRVTRQLGIDKSYNREDLIISDRIWLEQSAVTVPYHTSPRIGIDYAGEPWKSKLWRFAAV